MIFIVSDTRLYKRLCPPVHPLVRHGDGVKNAKTHNFDAAIVIICLRKCVWGGPGVDEGCAPLPTRPQR